MSYKIENGFLVLESLTVGGSLDLRGCDGIKDFTSDKFDIIRNY